MSRALAFLKSQIAFACLASSDPEILTVTGLCRDGRHPIISTKAKAMAWHRLRLIVVASVPGPRPRTVLLSRPADDSLRLDIPHMMKSSLPLPLENVLVFNEPEEVHDPPSFSNVVNISLFKRGFGQEQCPCFEP